MLMLLYDVIILHFSVTSSMLKILKLEVLVLNSGYAPAVK